jgi:hypothetical protein
MRNFVSSGWVSTIIIGSVVDSSVADSVLLYPGSNELADARGPASEYGLWTAHRPELFALCWRGSPPELWPLSVSLAWFGNDAVIGQQL